MIRITVELISVCTGDTTKLGEMYHHYRCASHNKNIGHYIGRILRSPKFTFIQREETVRDHRRNALTIWYLVAKMLKNMGYTT
jgi:hypothetical protein